MRPRLPVLGLVLALVLSLAACGQGREETGDQPVPTEGLYTCYRLTFRDLELTPQRRWLRLLPEGKGTLFLSETEEPGTWTLEGDAFRWTSQEGGTQAEGTWTEGVLTLRIGEMTGLFVREGVVYPPPEESGEAPGGTETTDPADTGGDSRPQRPQTPQKPEIPADTAQKPGQDPADSPEADQPAPAGPAPQEAPLTTLSCYGGLYYVDYDPQVFSPGPTGGADLVKEDGTQVWFARLSSRDLMNTWLAGMKEKGAYQDYRSFESHSDEIIGFPAQSIVYQDDAGWHAETILDLGRNRGTGSLPLFAIYLTCDGPSRDAVWTDGLAAFLFTLRLGEAN